MIAVVGARVRQLLARSPWILWAVIGALALAAAALAARAMARVDDARAAWGDTRAVLVATADIEPGAALAGVTRLEEMPSPLVPASAINDIDAATTARQAIAAGEVVVAHDVAARAGAAGIDPRRLAGRRGGRARGDRRPHRRPSWPSRAAASCSPSKGWWSAPTPRAVLVAVPADEAAQVAQAAAMSDVALLIQP